ncbi:GAF domain-containing protein [Candidatus Cyanaurora vandensis]|uniref:GAF domain-containing protein n=1 Tax=Candidatus Cyanaurora vandensis TaxID=2714958 RepID=UPI00257A1580|nr:GAF domain-containing protein [Candidatus Cyanaurora vandensis]
MPHNLIAAVSRLGSLLQAPGVLEVKLKQFYEGLQESLGCELVWVGLLQDKGRAILGKGGCYPSYHGFLFTPRFIEPGDLEDLVTQHHKLLQIPDIQQDTRCRPWWKLSQEWGLHGVVAFPLMVQGECLGLGVLGQSRWGLLLQAEAEECLMLLGSLVGSAIVADQGLARRQEQLTSPLLTMADRLRQAYDVETVLQAVVDELHDRLGPTRTVIYWLADSREFEVRAFTQKTTGYYIYPLGMRLTVKEISGLYQQLCQDRTTSIADLQRDLRGYLSKTTIQRLQLKAILAHPIILQKQLLGYLSLEQCDQPRIWTEQEQSLVQGMANLIGVTTTQAKLYEMERRRFLEQILINRIVQDIRNSLDPNEVMGAAVDRLGQGLNVDRCVLLNYDPQAAGLKVLHQFCKPGIPLVDPFLPWPQADADGQALTSAVPIGVEDTDTDFRFLNWRETFQRGATRAVMLCGLAHQGQPNGILCLHRCFLPQPWTHEEREIFQAVADQVGIALGQAMLFQQTQERVELETKLNQAVRRLRAVDTGADVWERLLQQTAQALDAPQVILLTLRAGTWQVLNYTRPALLNDQPDPLPHAPLLDYILNTPECVALSGPLEGLGSENYSGLGERLVVQPELTGVLLVLDREERNWRTIEKQLLSRLIQEALLAYAQTNTFLKLRQLSQQLKELNAYRNTMVSIASHEMRTPLASISLFVETLLLDRELITNEELEQMQTECNRMTALLNNLTTLVNLESNNTQFNFHTIALEPFFHRLCKRILPLADCYRATVHFQDQTAGVAFVSDEQKLETILYNLLENACKHTPSGVQVTLSAQPQAERIAFRVSDDGQGIPTPKLATLFQPFIRVEDVMNHSKGGAGLGLAIAKETVTKLGGQINVQSEVGEGSTFTVLLPLMPQA